MDKPVRFCPFCGSDNLKVVKSVERCMNCRTVFILHYQRQLRKAARKKEKVS